MEDAKCERSLARSSSSARTRTRWPSTASFTLKTRLALYGRKLSQCKLYSCALLVLDVHVCTSVRARASSSLLLEKRNVSIVPVAGTTSWTIRIGRLHIVDFALRALQCFSLARLEYNLHYIHAHIQLFIAIRHDRWVDTVYCRNSYTYQANCHTAACTRPRCITVSRFSGSDVPLD